MTVSDVSKLLASLPQAREAGNSAYWNSVAPTILEQVLDEIATSYDFDFIMNDYSSVVTVADQSEYNIYGANNDLRDIMSVRYGSTKKVLEKVRTLDADDYLSGGNTVGSVAAWYPFKMNNQGFPIITLFDTPTTAGDALHIRYRMKKVPIERFPPSFGYVIAYGVLAWVSDAHYPLWMKALKKLIKRYETGGKDINIAQVDPHIVDGHNRRANLNRTG